MKTAWTDERPVQHLSLEWTSPEGADQRDIAREAVEALFAVTEEWMEIHALEVRAGCCDPDTFTDIAEVNPPGAFQLLVREPRRTDLSMDPTYRAIETRAPRIDRETVTTLVARMLAEMCGDSRRYETALDELIIHASSIPLPPGWTDLDRLALECYAGEIAIPVEQRDGRLVVAAPPVQWLIPQPVAVALMRINDRLRITVDVFWSPWAGELDRPDSALAQGVARVRSRGWGAPEYV
jgi:hypothetical protein